MDTMFLRRFMLALTFSVALGSLHNDAGADDGTTPDQRVLDTLIKLDRDDLWGEAVLREGGVRSIKVVSMKSDTVDVREVVGPLQERSATYAISEFRSLRELGEHRIPMRRAPFRPSRSIIRALCIESVVPGGGYFYVGESRQGLVMLSFSVLAAATAVATGESGVAGWVPIASWFKIASMVHLVDEVKAMNAAHSTATDAATASSQPQSPALRMGLTHRF